MNQNRCYHIKIENLINGCCSKSIQSTKWDAQATKWIQNVKPQWVLSNAHENGKNECYNMKNERNTSMVTHQSSQNTKMEVGGDDVRLHVKMT